MEKVRHIQQQLLRSRRLLLLVITLTLAVVAGTIVAACLHLRSSVRAQMADRDGEILNALARLQQSEDKDALDTVGTIDDVREQFNLVMKISRLDGMIGVRLFTPGGFFTNAFPGYIAEATLPAADLAELRMLKPVSHFLPATSLASVDLTAGLATEDRQVPLLEVDVPLHGDEGGHLAGVAQFLIQGEGLAREYAQLDRSLVWLGVKSFLVAGGILTLVLWLAFRRIHRANLQITERTEQLLQANQELVLAAKASAVGAVTSHLIHGLKNPISGLQGFMKSHQVDPESSKAGWDDAVATTQRMQSLITGVARILEEQQAAGDYEISLRELVEIVAAKMLPVARATGVHFFSNLATEATLTNREANLAILILENLIQNAFQATPEGKSVHLVVVRAGGKIHCEVRDEGPGIPDDVAGRLFTPCRSTKEGGSGIGLAISKQLATQIGATLELRSNNARGCVFRLSLPASSTTPAPLVPDAARRND